MEFKRILPILISCVSLVSANGADPTTSTSESVDLILVAGQSNAVGFDANPAELPTDVSDKEVLFWWRCGDPPPDEHDSTSGGKWTHLQVQPKGNPIQDNTQGGSRQYGNFHYAAGGFGPEIGMARTLRAKTQQPLAVVKVAFSGTALDGDWNPSGEGGSCYRSLLSETKVAIAAAKDQGITLRLRALVWVQGESDATPKAAPLYEKALGDMIASLRKDLESPDLIALLGVNSRFGNGTVELLPKIVESQKSLADKDPLCAYVDTSTASLANLAHFDAAGTLDIGVSFAKALLQVEAKSAARNEK